MADIEAPRVERGEIQLQPNMVFYFLFLILIYEDLKVVLGNVVTIRKGLN